MKLLINKESISLDTSGEIREAVNTTLEPFRCMEN